MNDQIPTGGETAPAPATTNFGQAPNPSEVAGKKVAAGVLAIILGSLGVHKFVLGYTKAGLILLGASCFGTCIGSALPCFGTPLLFLPFAAWVIGVIEGILYLTKTDQVFYETYMVNKKQWF